MIAERHVFKRATWNEEFCQNCGRQADAGIHQMRDVATTPPDFTPHPFVGIPAGELGLSTCERCGLQERDITHSLKFQLPSDFHEQARQLVEQWIVTARPNLLELMDTAPDLVDHVASFASEAATAALEQAARALAEGSDGVGGDWEAAEAAAAITKIAAAGDDNEHGNRD